MPVEKAELLEPLKRYFGFSSFRPHQEEIIHAALAGQDVFVLLPTGGGKSLCFQLPALVRPGLTVVISPLIALMKDQVDTLQAAGVPATFLNSSLSSVEARARTSGLHEGAFRLLRQSDPGEIAANLTVPVWQLAGLFDPVACACSVRSWLRQNCPSFLGTRIIWWADHNVLSTASTEAGRQVLGWMCR